MSIKHIRAAIIIYLQAAAQPRAAPPGALAALLLVHGALAIFCPTVGVQGPEAAQRLLAHHEALVGRCGMHALGPGPGEVTRALSTARGWQDASLPVYEHGDWPKPARCPAGPDPRISKNTCDFPTRFLVDRPHGVLVHLTWKAGITSLKKFWDCAFQARRFGGTIVVSPPGKGEPRLLAVGMAREPVSRLLSAYEEILKRNTVDARVRGPGARSRLLPRPQVRGASPLSISSRLGRQRTRERDRGAGTRAHHRCGTWWWPWWLPGSSV